MMEKFERVYDTAKYGIIAFIAFLSFYYVQTNFDDAVALLVFQLLTFWIALNILSNFQGIYTQGTYIRIVLEEGSETRWHKISRTYGEYYNEYMEQHGKKSRWNRCPYPIGRRWGRDPVAYAYSIIFLNASGILTVISKVINQQGFVPIFRDFVRVVAQHPFQTALVGGSFILFFLNLWIAYKLIFKMKKFREENEEVLKAYVEELKSKVTQGQH